MTIAERLTEAERAYHALMTGAAVARLRDQNGEMIEYTPANAARLKAYIEELKALLGQSPVTAGGPMRFLF